MVLQELNIRIGILIDELKKGAENAKKEAKGIEKAFGELKTALIGMGVFAFVKDAIIEFSKAERVSNMLANRIRSLGGDYKTMTAEVMRYVDAASEAAKIDDDELKQSMITLIDITKDARVSMALMNDIMDIHVGTGMDLQRATELVGRAYNGQRGELQMLAKQFGVAQVDATSFGAVMGKVRSQVEGAAAGANDLKAGLDQLKVKFSNLSEEAGQLLSGGGIWTGFVAGILDATTRGLKVINSFQKALRDSWDNIGNIFKKGFKSSQENAKKIFDTFLQETTDALRRTEKDKSDVQRVEQGKRQRWSDVYDKRVRKQQQEERMKVIQAENQEMKNRVALGQATLEDLLRLQKSNADEVAAIYGRQSKEFMDYQNEMISIAREAYAGIYELGNAAVTALSTGFEAMFQGIIDGSADAGAAIEMFGRAMAKSLLNSVASVIEGEAMKGMAGFLSNMLIGGPVMSGATAAYSLPLIASLSALAGVVRGISAGLAEGGVMAGPALIPFAEKEPEAAIPFSRMDEAFQMYRRFLGKSGSGDGNRPVNVTIDNRGAMILDSGFEERRAAKKMGDALKRMGII